MSAIISPANWTEALKMTSLSVGSSCHLGSGRGEGARGKEGRRRKSQTSEQLKAVFSSNAAGEQHQ